MLALLTHIGAFKVRAATGYQSDGVTAGMSVYAKKCFSWHVFKIFALSIVCYAGMESLVSVLFTKRQIFRGFSFFSSSGKKALG